MRHQKEDLSDPALLPEDVGLGRVAQMHPATDRQNELAIAHVIGKLTHLGWIRVRKHTLNLHRRI